MTPAIDRTAGRGFETAIRESPLDPTPHLVYADWLEERGDEEGAAVHRAAGLWLIADQRAWCQLPLDLQQDALRLLLSSLCSTLLPEIEARLAGLNGSRRVRTLGLDDVLGTVLLARRRQKGWAAAGGGSSTN